MSNQSCVIVERVGHTMCITLNRPEARNAIDLNTAMAVGDAIELAEHEPDVRVVVVTGAGSQAFCAGADLKALSRGESIVPTEARRKSWGFAGIVSHPISKPIIAAVNGFALGGGTEIVLASDMVIASENASFGLPEVRRGIIAAAGGAFRLASQIPRKLAMQMMLTGEPIDARTALSFGLVNAVVSPSKLMDAAMSLAESIGANAPLAVQATKRIALGIQDGTILPEEDSWHRTQKESALVWKSEDAKEGPKAFAEKRNAVWQSR